MEIPKWSRSYLHADRIKLVEAAVQEAEATTSGEIVPMIVRRSSTVGHVQVIVLCMLVILFFLLDGPARQADLVGEHWGWYLVDIVVFLLAASLCSRLPLVQRLLTAKPDREDQVEMRAEIEFYELGIKNTVDETGVLLFVSLMEQRAVVLADKAISAKVPGETWSEVCNLLIRGIKGGNMALAFAEAIKRCGEILTPLFPVKPNDINELKDHLIIKE